MSDMAIGALLCLGVIGIVIGFGLVLNHHQAKRLRPVLSALAQIQRTMGIALGQYQRLDEEVRDAREVLADHASLLSELKPNDPRARRPKP